MASFRPTPRCLVYADLSATEYATVKRLATRDGLTIANFVRRAVNSVLMEEGLEDELVEERQQGNPTVFKKKDATV